MESLICTHCLGKIGSGKAVFEDAENGTMVFCCLGCQGIYHLIRDAGLGRFYQEREGWKAGRPEISRPSASAFQVRMTAEEAEADLVLSEIRCSSCVWLIEKYLAKLPGIISARVNYATHRARVRWDHKVIGLEAILDRIAALGYRPLPFVTGIREEVLARERRSLLIRLAAAAFFAVQIMLFSVVLYEGCFRGMDPSTKRIIGSVLWALATPVLFYAGYPFLKNTVKDLRVGAVSMDTLVAIGSVSAYLYSVFSLTRNAEVYFDTSAMIITLILLGRFLEAGARQKSSESISALMGLQPVEARAMGKGAPDKSSMVPISSLSAGDLIEVIPGDSAPFDCEVLEGESEVDESMLTGESLPVFKSGGSEVFFLRKGSEARQLGRLFKKEI
jgi:Cu2+-exporting ATPase